MRFVAVVCSVAALALAGMVYSSAPADAAKTKKGCVIGKEKWDAGAGQCAPAKAAPKKAAAKKAAPKKK